MITGTDSTRFSVRKDFDQLWQLVKRERDQLRTQIQFARSEVRDEWEQLEEKWRHLNRKKYTAKHKQQAAKQKTPGSSEQATESWRSLVDEIQSGYRNIRQMLRSLH